MPRKPTEPETLSSSDVLAIKGLFAVQGGWKHGVTEVWAAATWIAQRISYALICSDAFPVPRLSTSSFVHPVFFDSILKDIIESFGIIRGLCLCCCYLYRRARLADEEEKNALRHAVTYGNAM